MKTTNHAAQNAILKLCGSAGYMAWTLQFLVLVALYFERFYNSSAGKALFPTYNGDVNLPPEHIDMPSITLPTTGVVMILMLFLGVALIGFVAYVVTMRYIPAVNKTAAKVVHETTEQTIKQVERVGRKKLSTRKRRTLSARVAWWLKVFISIVPVLIVMFVGGAPLVSKQAAIVGVGVLSLWAVICFAAQTSLAYVWRKTAQVDGL